MDKNPEIKRNLENHINRIKKAFKDRPFLATLEKELKEFKTVPWFASPGVDVDELKKEHETNLLKLLDDHSMQKKMNGLLDALIDPNDRHIQDKLKTELFLSIESLEIHKKRTEHSRYNLLFFEHDFDYRAFLTGFEDLGYQFGILSGKEYLKFDHNPVYCMSKNSVNYDQFLFPILNIEEELGEDKIELINEVSEYLYEVKDLFVRNAYLALHLCFEQNHQEIRQIDSPSHEQVYVFANEHDCEQMNIYVI